MQEVPDHTGILDRALAELGQNLPSALALTFSQTAVGFRCFELPEIIDACMEICLVEWSRGDMRLLQLKPTIDHALEIAWAYGNIENFQLIGEALVAAIQEQGPA